ncbi:MAG: Flp pilus assembly complex ATPase component TadA [Candidatus Omnitrophica bacterium]|nr:Flp pilus assembly complex ATPase component TadA [Candidatus Omnitrophota bacterium]
MKTERLGSILIKKGFLSADDLDFCLAVQSSSRGKGGEERLGHILVHYNLAREEDVARALSEQVGWPFYDGEYVLNAEGARLIGSVMKEGMIFPATVEDDLVFVVADPYDTRISDHVAQLSSGGASFCVGRASAVSAAAALIANPEWDNCCFSSSSFGQPVKDVHSLAFGLLEAAAGMNATDIHIEPSEKAVEIRFRIDGLLRFHSSLALEDLPRLVNIFFHKAEISPGDFLRFHDARFEHGLRSQSLDIRLSHIPTVNGSSLVLRILDKARSALSLENLGYAPEHWQKILHAIRHPHGMVLLTGPTGCGKTTSLYSMLNYLKSISTKIVTVEDPVEMRIPLAAQAAVDLKKGHDFSSVTRAFLRHDPDIMLIGEIRDEMTAREAVRAAITGHKIFSTLHTNDTASAVLRLHDLGVHNSYIANTLLCVVAQRLVRKLCPFCREAYEVRVGDADEFERAYLTEPLQKVFRPRGCAHCFDGHHNRTVVAEILFVDDEIRFLIEQGLVNEITLRLKARKNHITMRNDAARLVREGIISLEEAIRVVG